MLKQLPLIFSFFLLASCASMQRPTGSSQLHQMTWTQRKAQLQAIHSWTLRGSLSIHTPKQAHMTSATWHQMGRNRYAIQLFAPLSLGSIRIDGQPGRVTLIRSAHDQVSATTPEGLLRSQLGWTLPITNLYYWVRGLPTPNRPAKTFFDRYHHLLRLDQEGWQVFYINYRNYHGIDLPWKMALIHQNIRIKFAITQWQTRSDMK